MAESKPKGYLARHGAQMIDNGYMILPIKRGSKAPSNGDDWQKTRADKRLLKTWLATKFSMSGVGILTRNTPAVDIDILDPKLSKHMVDFVQENFGPAPVRVGLAPKTLLLFRTEKPFSKINSNTWEDEWGDPDLSHSMRGAPTGHLRKVEILGDGQQFVSFAVHPDTGKPYQWIGRDTPATVPVSELPLLTEEDAQAIVAEFERVCAISEGYTLHKTARALARVRGSSSGAGRHDPDDVFASDTPKTDLSDDELHAKLLLVPGWEDYETWLQVGMALFHQYDGEPRGLELWHEWSEQAPNYRSEALDEKWDTFDIAAKGRAPVTARLIIKLAGEAQKEIATETFAEIRHELASANSLDDMRKVCERVKHIEFDLFARNQIVGNVKDAFKRITGTALTVGAARDMVRYEKPSVTEAPRWLEGWVYISLDESFYNIDKRTWLSNKAFNHVHARFLLTKQDVLEGRSSPEQAPSDVALNIYQIPVVQNRMYFPGEDDMFSLNSTPYVNSYDPRNVPDTPRKWSKDETAAVNRVIAHGELLFRVKRDRELFLDALAYIVQNPGKRINWGILLQGAEGDGKSFYSGLLAAVLGPENVNNIIAEALNEKYNSWSEGAQIVFCEEIKLHGHNRFDVLNKIKPMLTNPLVSIRRMQTDWYSAVNMSTYILTTNFRDALPLDDGDSRYFILFSWFQMREEVEAFEKENPTYFDDLFATLEHAGALRDWLLTRKLSKEFNPKKRAPMSDAKAEMVSYSKSDEQTALEEIILESEEPDLCGHLLNATKLADEMADRGVDAPYGRSMNTLLLKVGFTLLGRVRLEGKSSKQLFWSRKPSAFRGSDGKVDPLLVKAWIRDAL